MAPEADAEAAKPEFRFPSAFTTSFSLIILVAVFTLIIPAGQNARLASENFRQGCARRG